MPSDARKTKKELIIELSELRQMIATQESGISPAPHKTDRRFADSINDIEDGLVELDAIGTILDVNKAAVTLFGGSREELVGKHFTKIGLFSLRQTFQLLSKFKCIMNGKSIDRSLQIVNKKGRLIHLESTVLLKKRGKIPIGAVAVIRDVTATKEAEKAIRESEEKYRLIFETAANLITSVDSEGILVDCNNRLEKILGYKREELIGQNMGKVIHPDYHLKAQESLAELIANGTAHNKKYKMVRKDGGLIDVSINSSSITDQQGNFVRSICIIDDITERRQAEEMIEKQNYYLTRAQEIGSIGAWELDLISNLLVWTDENYRVFGVPLGTELNYELFLGCVHPDDREFVDREWKAAIEGKPYDIEHRLIVNGKTKWVREKADLLRDEDGRAVSAIGFTQDISKHKRAEEALQESESNLLEAQRIAQLGHYALDIRTGCWTSSAELDHIFGLDDSYRKDVAGWLHIIHPDHKEIMSEYLQIGILGKEREFDNEYKIIDATSGQEKWVHGRGSLKFDENGDLIEMFGTIQDITDLKQAERALREFVEATSSHFGDALFDSVAAQLAKTLNADYTLIGELRNTQETSITTIAVTVDGAPAENFTYELAGTPCENVLNKSICSYESGVAQEFPEDALLVQMGVEGYVGVPLFDSQGAPLGIMAALFREPIANTNFAEAILQVFSSRIGSELERKQADEKLALLLDNLPCVAMILEKGTRKIVASNSAARKLGAVPGETCYRTCAKREKSCTFCRAPEVWKTNETKEIEIQYDGTWSRGIWVPLTDDLYVHYIFDITETKRLQALESRAERLEMAGTIAGQVAHDFNNLLAPMMAYPEFIREELPHDHSAHAYLDTIEEAAQKIADINQDLLTMSRRGHYNQRVLDLNRLVLQAVNEIQSRTETMTVEMDLCEGLSKFKGGTAQIHRMLTNLIVNARDAMNEIGQLTIKTENYYADDTSVAFGRVPKGEYVKLTISDNGCGIPEDIIQKVLDPFFTTKTADKKRGSGLGLSIVDAVMKDHKGYLDLSSKVGHGTSFYLYFPITREETGEDQSTQLSGGTEKLLIVDDDVIQREVSARLLTALGYRVRSVESGEKAIEFLRDNRSDLLVLDMVMPGGIDGAETYRRILEFSPHQKAIILSGFSESDRVLKAQKLGAGAFVRKPITKGVIAAAVRTELDRAAVAVGS